MWVTLVGPRRAFSFQKPCKLWKCPKCRKELIKYYIDEIKNRFKGLLCVHVFVGYRTEKGKDLSNFTSRKVSGHYCRINGIDASAIISDRKIEGAKREDKKKFLEHTLPEILNQPWDKWRRVSFSRGWEKLQWEEGEGAMVPNSAGSDYDSGYFAMVIGAVSEDFNKLYSEAEKKEWQRQQKEERQIMKLYPKGDKFLRQESSKERKQVVSPGERDILGDATVNDETDMEAYLRLKAESKVSNEDLSGQFPPYSCWEYDDLFLDLLAMEMARRMVPEEKILARIEKLQEALSM